MDKPFWEDSYKLDDVATFGISPNPTIQERWPMFEKNGAVLDVGCGEGKNAIFLASKGFVVDAFDISGAGIEKLNRLAVKNRVNVSAWVQDLRDYSFNKDYDVITSHGTLHFVAAQDWKKFILEAKEKTKSRGIHIMQIFTNRIPASPDIEPFVKGLANEGELFKLYEDWEIIETKSYIFEDEHPGVETHFHASNKIVARNRK
ncbi:MAG: methyltransferase domain-containing protein [Desulfobacter sp.]|nr:MAG: methyltransferase domain-containing protein [Desulfobacter sp.]